MVEQHRIWIEQHELDVKGRIYFSSQGVNAQFGGPKRDALAYTQHLMQHPLFSDLRYDSRSRLLQRQVLPDLRSSPSGAQAVPPHESL